MCLTAGADFIGSEYLIEEPQNLPDKAHEAGCMTDTGAVLARIVFRHRNAAIVAESVSICVVMSCRRNYFMTAQVLLAVGAIDTGGKAAFGTGCGNFL